MLFLHQSDAKSGAVGRSLGCVLARYSERYRSTKKLTAEGYEVEAYVQALLKAHSDAASYSFQSVFQTQRGLYAKADVTRDNGDGTINLYEVKSSTSVKNNGQHNQIKDAAFQKIAAEEAGLKIARVFIVHLNKDYVRQGDIDPEELLIFADVTSDVAEIEADTRAEIDGALAMLAQQEVDESSCSCLQLTKSNHCDSFDYFNPAIPTPSIYTLPRISKAKIAGFVADGRFDLDEIGLGEVTDKQAPVLQSAHLKTPMSDERIAPALFVQFLLSEHIVMDTCLLDVRLCAPNGGRAFFIVENKKF
jgi:hypothetical protein